MSYQPLQVKGELLSNKRVGAYQLITIVVPGIPERIRPGNFVALSVGGESTSTLLRRSFSVYQAQERGLYGGTLELVISAHGPGTRWLAALAPHQMLDVVGPLGRPFPLPKDPVHALLVGGGYGSAPLFMLADALRQRGCRVDMALGAASAERLFGALEARRVTNALSIATDDGSLGVQGRVTDAARSILERSNIDVIYACGPMPMLAALSTLGAEFDVMVQCAVEESMACGIGICMTCVLPVRGSDGVVRMSRSCVDGPIFAGDRVLWESIGTVPEETLGAPKASGH